MCYGAVTPPKKKRADLWNQHEADPRTSTLLKKGLKSWLLIVAQPCAKYLTKPKQLKSQSAMLSDVVRRHRVKVKCFTMAQSNLYGMVDAQIAVVEGELLAGTTPVS